MIRRSLFAAAAVSALVFSFQAADVHAQAGQATLSGTITDSTGGIIPGAKAVLIQESSKTQRSVVSDKNGNVAFVAIPPDTYDILVTAPGFRPSRENGIAVHINDQLDLRNIVLEVAGNDVSVTVTSESNNVTPTTSGEQSYTLTDKQIQNLNIESRSAIELLDLIPVPRTPATSPVPTTASRPASARTRAPIPSTGTGLTRCRSSPTAHRSPTSTPPAPPQLRQTST